MAPSRAQVQALLYALDQKLVLREVARPSSGFTGTVFRLMMGQGEFILKISPDLASDWKLTKERIVYRLLPCQGVPAPNLLAADFSRRLVPFAYTLCECLPGVTLASAYSDLPDAGKRGVYRQLGDLLGRMHSLTFEGFGDVAEQERKIIAGPAQELAEEAKSRNVGPFSSWREMHREIVRGRLAFLSRTEFSDLAGPIAAWFAGHDDLLDDAVTPRLLHMDLHRSNILVSSGQITGIIDVEESVIGHNEYDLMRLALAHFGEGEDALRKAFFQSYQAHITLDAGYERRWPFYEMSRMLVGLRCLVVFANSNPEETHRARTRVYELLNL